MYSQTQLDFYSTVKEWLSEKLSSHNSPSPFFVGLSSPNGAGKSTLTQFLVDAFSGEGQNAVGVSIDDFYLKHSDQKELAETHPEVHYWQQRGYPGTHDIELGLETLRALKRIKDGQQVMIPRYDKSAFAGQGDRLPTNQWSGVTGPIDIVILEGWMLGFQALPTNESSPLLLANQALAQYTSWHKTLDAFIYLKAEDPSYVIDWRIEAEQKRREQGLGAMSAAAARDYAKSFVDIIEKYQDTPCKEALEVKHFLEVPLAKSRGPVNFTKEERR